VRFSLGDESHRAIRYTGQDHSFSQENPMKAALQAILAAARTGHGSYGPNYDPHKLADGINALLAQLDEEVEEVHQFKKKEARNWSTDSPEYLDSLQASEDNAGYDFRILYTQPRLMVPDAREPDTSRVGRDLDDVPQPYAGAVVLLETIAACGAQPFFANGDSTPMRQLCQRFAGELRSEGKLHGSAPESGKQDSTSAPGVTQASPRISPRPVLMDGVIELCAPDKNGLLVAIAPESVKMPASWTAALQRVTEFNRDR
jgi:hypothetical protein